MVFVLSSRNCILVLIFLDFFFFEGKIKEYYKVFWPLLVKEMHVSPNISRIFFSFKAELKNIIKYSSLSSLSSFSLWDFIARSLPPISFSLLSFSPSLYPILNKLFYMCEDSSSHRFKSMRVLSHFTLDPLYMCQFCFVFFCFFFVLFNVSLLDLGLLWSKIGRFHSVKNRFIQKIYHCTC